MAAFFPQWYKAGCHGRLRTAVLAIAIAVTAVVLTRWFVGRHTPKSPENGLTGESGRPPEMPAPVSQDFAGSQACRECHREIWERYQTHPMAHSMFRVLEADPLEDYEAQTGIVRGGRRYRVEKTEAGVLHHESAVDAEGAVIYDQAVQVQFAIGSGKRGRTYVIDRGGLLFESPLSWYSEKECWDLSPGYSASGHQRFERRITGRCLSCHAGRIQSDPRDPNRFDQPPLVEFAIGCERCHGPAGDHVRRQRTAEPPAGDDLVAVPSRFGATRREDVCNQCHLLGIDEVLRYGRTDFDFRPGMHVGEVWSIVAPGTGIGGENSTEAVSQVQQMRSSRCYRGSEGRLGCISCHDPHSIPADAERPDYYRQRCLECHSRNGCSLPQAEQLQSSAGSCIHCHMPRLGSSDVPHVTQTDHRIVRRAGGSDRKVAVARRESAGRPRIFDVEWAPLPDSEASRAEGIVLARRAEQEHSAALADLAAARLQSRFRAVPDDLPVADAYAVANSLLQRKEAALEAWRRTVAIDPQNETALFSLAVASANRGDHGTALGYLDRLIQVNPWHAHYHRRRSLAQEALGNLPGAIESGRQALQLNPSQLKAYRWLAELCARAGRQREAQQYLRQLERLEGLERE